MPNQPPGAPGPRFTAQLTGLDYALPGTLARRFMRCGQDDPGSHHVTVVAARRTGVGD